MSKNLGPVSQNYLMIKIYHKTEICHKIYLSCFTKLSYLMIIISDLCEILRHPTTCPTCKTKLNMAVAYFWSRNSNFIHLGIEQSIGLYGVYKHDFLGHLSNLGDLLLWVGVRRRQCCICRIRRQEIVNFITPSGNFGVKSEKFICFLKKSSFLLPGIDQTN